MTHTRPISTRLVSVFARKFALAALLFAGLTGCDQLDRFLTVDAPVEQLVPQIISVRPHDASAFTEGLFLADGYLYESTGRYGQSTLREVDPQTGEVVRGVNLPAEFFGEGIALVGDRIYQLTWREGGGFIFDRETFDLVDVFQYTAEGWGMCYDGEHLYTSDGSPVISQRDPETMAALATITVERDGQPVEEINELECVDESIYANVWHSDDILRIDKASGRVTAVVDTSGLLTPEQRSTLGSEATLNGIAYDAEQGTFLITGKLWAWLFEVEFVPSAE